MDIIEDLREKAGFPGPVASLANDMLVFTDQLERGELTLEEYQYLISQIADIRSQQELSNDEVAMRWAIFAAQTLLSLY